MKEDQGAQIARRLELLLERFPHPEGRPWKGSEIEQESGGIVSQPYFSALRRGRFRRPGMEQLQAIADVMGFPLELWQADPEDWPRILEQRWPGATEISGVNSEKNSVADSLKSIRRSVLNPQTNEPYTDREIAQQSAGRLTAEDVHQIESGENASPSYDKIVALSEIFNVSTDYWRTGSGRRNVSLDARLLDMLSDPQTRHMLWGWRTLSNRDRDTIVTLIENFESSPPVENSDRIDNDRLSANASTSSAQ